MLKDLFVSEVRINILKLMLPNPERPIHVRGIVRAVGTEINAVRRELKRLHELGLLKKRQSSNRLYYTVDTTNMFYAELLSLVAKEEGLGADIINRRKELGDVKFAILSRRFSRNIESSVLDVDLFMIGTINFDALEVLIKENQAKIGREIHYSVLGSDEFMFRKRRNDQFVSKVMAQGRTMLIGDEEEFSAMQ
jgi:predicted transcriptional regulator